MLNFGERVIGNGDCVATGSGDSNGCGDGSDTVAPGNCNVGSGR